jgi:hypothetical protein
MIKSSRFFIGKWVLGVGFLFCFFLAGAGSALASIEIVDINFGGGKWVNPDEPLKLKLNRLAKPEEGRLAVFIGQMDITSLVETTGTELIYNPSLVPLPSGLTEVIVFTVSDSHNWAEFARFPLKVLTKLGFEESAVTPSLDINLKSKFGEDRTQDAGDAIRPSPNLGINFQAGLSTRHKRGDLQINSQVDVLGVSFDEDALRFSEKGEQAPKVDLVGYLIVVQKGSAIFSMGHNNYGSTHTLLGTDNNRGVNVKYKKNRFDVSVSSMNGRSIVGWENPSGLANFDNNISSGAVGMEILEDRPGDLRVEFMYLDGSILPVGNFNQGQVVDAEKSNGFSFRLQANNIFDRVRADAQFARSTFVNATDDELFLGTGGISSNEVTENARDIQLGIQLIQGMEIGENKFFSLNLTGYHGRVDPLYRSVAAFVTADQLTNGFSFDSEIAGTNLFYKYTEREDNLDDIASILKTKNRTHEANFVFPTQFLFSDPESPNPWLPNLAYSFLRNHQFGVSNPTLFANGFDATQIPDQILTTHFTEASWFGDWWDLAYRFNYSFQDNRQTGRNLSDFKEIVNELAVGVRPVDTLSVNLSLSRVEQDDIENGLLRYTNNANLGFNWGFMELWTLSGNYGLTREGDSNVLNSTASVSASTQLARQFELKLPGVGGGRSFPGRFFIGHTLQSNNAKDNVFNNKSYARFWTVNAGVSLSVF